MKKQVAQNWTIAVPLLLVSLFFLEIAFGSGVLHPQGFSSRAKTRFLRLGGVRFAIADFDGDWKPDLALVETTGLHQLQSDYAIQFQFSAGPRLSVFVRAPSGGIRVAARDVNGDDLPDLVVSSALDERVVAVLLNQGHGHFSQAQLSSYSGIPVEPNTFFHTGDKSISDKYTVLSLRYSFDGERVGRVANPNAVATDSIGTPNYSISPAVELDTCRGRSPPASTRQT